MFDNDDGALAELPYSEVSIARRLHRGGEGQYLLNGATVRPDRRRRAARRRGSRRLGWIISQGRVEEILGSKPDERLLVEERGSASSSAGGTAPS